MSMEQTAAGLSAAIELLEEGQGLTLEAKIKTEELPPPYGAQLDAKTTALQELQAIREDVQALLGRLAALSHTLADGEEAASTTNTLLDLAAGRAGSAQFTIGRSLEVASSAIGGTSANAAIAPAQERVTALWTSLNEELARSPNTVLGFAHANKQLEGVIHLMGEADTEILQCTSVVGAIGPEEGPADAAPDRPAVMIRQAEAVDLTTGVAIVQLQTQLAMLRSSHQ